MRPRIVLPRTGCDLGPVCEAYPAELMVTVGAYGKQLVRLAMGRFCDLTCHVEAGLALLDVLVTVRTRLGVVCYPVLCLLVLWIAMISCALKFLTAEAFVPRNHVLVAHFKGTLLAVNMRVSLIIVVVELTVGTSLTETPSEVFELADGVEVKIAVIPKTLVSS